MTAALILASLMLVSTSLTTRAAEPLELMSTNGSSVETILMGDYDFDLYNRTSGWVLNGFYTKEDGVWSKNWLKSKLGVGKWVHMVWNSASNEGGCVVPFKVTWDDYDQAEIYTVDWCKKPIKSIFLKDTTFTVEYR
jgi:hypothetical protein